MSEVNRFGLVGCGHRGIQGFVEEAVKLGVADRLAALCDPNPVRLKVAREHLRREVRLYTDYAGLLKDSEINWVIVCTPDGTHRDLTVQAFAAGKNVVTEKPMATTVAECDDMIRAARAAGRRLRCVFNLRYSRGMRAVHELIRAGMLGRLVSVEAFDILRVGHGSDYLRRWHRQRRNSGGLLVHKGCHVFDILNWWIGSEPTEVYARGSRQFFTPRPGHGDHCRDCSIADRCELYVDISKGVPTGVSWETLIKDLYLDAEKEDGYLRDRCVFAEEIDVWDNTSVVVSYANGVTATYTEVLFAPFAARRYVLNGTQGRLEIGMDGRGIVFHPLFRGTVTEKRAQMMNIQAPSTNPPEVIDPASVLGDRLQARGGHGGTDGNLLLGLVHGQHDDPSAAGPLDGRRAVLIAEAANRSVDQRRAIRVAEEFPPAS
jgi:predicted dehydrogenase